MDIVAYNRRAWDTEVDKENKWTQPVGELVIAEAREGRWEVVLTPSIPVPREWFGELSGKDVLCLASGGGQQAPIFAAAGARVTLLDNSPRQLAQDRLVAERDSLEISLHLGDMADLSQFSDASFDLIFHPCSNCFAPEIKPVWREAYRVLRAGGALLAGFGNPLAYCGDPDAEAEGRFELRYATPYSDIDSLTEEECKRYTDVNEPLLFGHSLEDQIGGQLEAGFLLAGFFEDRGGGYPIDVYTPGYMATRALKMS